MDKELLIYYWSQLIIPSVGETLYILFFTMLFVTIFGFFIAILLYITDKQGLYPRPRIHFVLNTIINTIRSIPVVILIIVLFPVVRLLLGTSIGTQAAIIYMSIMCVAFVARLLEGQLKSVDKSLIEAGKSMGLSHSQIIFKIIVHEAIPSMILGLSFSTIMIMGNIAFAGMVGAGGIGALTLNYGYAAFNSYIMYSSIVIMFLLTVIIQLIGRFSYEKLK